MTTSGASLYEYLASLSWLKDLDSVVIDRLAAHTRVLTLKPGEVVSHRGREQTHLVIVQEGSLEISVYGRDGKRYVLRHISSGELFGLIAILDGRGSVHDACARGATTILQIAGDVLLAEIKKEPTLALRLLHLICHRFRQVYDLLAIQQLLPLPVRVAQLILSLSHIEPQLNAGADEDEEIALHLKQSELSDMLGMSRQSLSTELKKLERAGLIRLAHTKLTVTDMHGLASHVQAFM
jgi:CRP/FNR family transcriptional regulator, cyclic AMP receptor protein